MPLTEHQELAAESRGGGRLVAAAAGSGKTKVLVERLMRYVDRGANIDDFVVITYTRAAAGELRSRILSALNERIARDPANRRLRRQTELACRASIGTIDSLCGRILRENTHLAGISPDFRVMDAQRAEELRKTVLDHVLDGLYDRLDDDPGAKALVDSFGAGRNDDKLAELVVRVHDAVQSHPDPEAWLSEQRKALAVPVGEDAGQNEWGKYLLDRTAMEAEYWAGRIDDVIAELAVSEDEKLKKAYYNSLCDGSDQLHALKDAAAAGWDAARAASAIKFPRSVYRGDDVAAKERILAVRDPCKKMCEVWKSRFADSSETLLAEIASTRPAMDALLSLTMELDRAYAAEKRRQGLCDFSDQEHMVLRLLKDKENGLAASLSARYAEVLVDEYQDVNACQDALFALLSDGGKKLFMVGDVKQSIYRFRLADPTIFLQKYESWNNITPVTPEGEPGRILLQDNFRSRPEVLDAANHVFRSIMSHRLGEIEYDDAAELRSGRPFPEGAGAKAELVLLQPPIKEDEDPDADAEDTDGGDISQRPDKVRMEARYVASRIRQMVDSHEKVTTDDNTVRDCTYGDFAILLRSNVNIAPRYTDALAELGIPSVSQQGGGFYRSTEITALLSMLAVIDNPRQDVALIAALRSPLFGFTADELSAIRAADKKSDFYTALCLRAEEDTHCAEFLAQLSELRAVAQDISVEALLERVCDKTDLYALLAAMPNGDARRENVHILADFARQFEQEGYRGLFRFVQWMKQLAESGEEPRTGSLESRDAVQIVTIHRSKGLEYPIVFIASAGKQFNLRDSKEPVLIHPKLGVGGKVIDTNRGITYPTIAWRALSEKKKEEALSEEMRVLYVAMTRPKDRLIITATWADVNGTLAKLREGLTSPVSPELLRKDTSYSKWLARAALLSENMGEQNPLPYHVVYLGKDEPEKIAPPEEPAPDAAECAEFTAVLDWNYPYAWAEELPSKITASALEGTDADPDAENIAPAPKRRRSFRMPSFGKKDAPLTGTAKGVAVHTVLQFIDYSRVETPEGVQSEIDRLLAAGHITPAQAASVEPERICTLFASPIGQRILHADEVWRELRFSMLTPAERVFAVPAGEEVLLQGVADCCIREGDSLTVVDYKTDFVTEETLAERAAEYAPQIRAYAAALERLLKKPVREGVLYFLRTGQSVAVDCKGR